MAKLSKMERLEQAKKTALARARNTAKAIATQQQHTLIAVGSAYAIGAMEHRNIDLPTIKKVDAKLLYGVAALAAGFMLRDKKLRAVAQSMGDGLLSIVAYNQAKGIDAVGDAFYDPEPD
jgi:hypothetical protein